MYVACVLLVEVILPQTLFITPVFPTLPRKIPCVFPVKVTYKTSTKKNAKAKTKKLTYTMKVAKASVALSGDSAVAVGSTTKLTTTKKASSRAKIAYTSSDETIATVSEDGTVKGVKAGKATITARLVIGKDTATATQEVEVKNYVLQSVAQTKSNTLQGVILGETKNIKATDIKITNTATQNVIAVKNVTPDKADASKVTIETFADMKDGAKYTVELDGVAKEFTATDGVVTDVNVTPVTIPANTTGTEIKGQTVDKDGIVIDEFKVSEASSKNAELNLSTTQGYVDGDKLVLPTVGNKGTAEVKYHTYKFDTNGNEIGAYTKKIDITAVAEDAITTTGFNMTFADKAPNWDKDKTTNQLAIGSSKNAYFKFVGSDNKEITNYDKYSVVSSDDSILLLPKTQLTSSTTEVKVSGIKEGNAYINVLNKDGKVIKSLPVVVTATGKLTNVTLGNTSLTISKNAKDITNSVSVKAVDQYNNDITGSSTVTPTGVNDDAKKVITAKWNPTTKAVEVSASSDAEDGKTYTIKVEVKNDNVTVNRYFTVKTVKTETDVTKATDLRVEVSGLTDGKVDMAVADDADATKATKTVTVQVAAYDKGAKIGYVKNATYEINNDKQSTVTSVSTGASISVVSCSAVGVVSKNLEAGKSYTVTVKTANKTFTTTFAVVDTQASATVKVTKKTTTKTMAEDILAETCEVTYDGKKLENPEFTVDESKDVKTVTTPTSTSTYIAKANVKVTKNHITYTVPVTINTTFTFTK